MPDSFAFIFDMDGVIVHSNPWHKVSLNEFVERYGFKLSDEELREKIYGRTNREWITNLFGPMPREKLDALEEEKESLFRELFRPHIRPLPGLVNFLEQIVKNKIPVAIATSAPPSNVIYTLELTGTRKFFTTILDETHITHGKPNPEIYLKTSAALKIDSSACIVFEDSLSGIKAAAGAGCKVVGITTTHTPEELTEADYVIDDFVNLEPTYLLKKVGL